MPDAPTPAAISGIVDSLKYALLPFTAIGGWSGLKWLWEQWALRGNREAQRQQAQVDEREKIRLSLDTRSTAYMDRLEQQVLRQADEIEKLRKWAKDEVERAEMERDILYQVALDREQNAHERRHNHIRTIQARNNLVVLFQRQADGKLSKEAFEEILALPPEEEPPRIADLRAHIRLATMAHREGRSPSVSMEGLAS